MVSPGGAGDKLMGVKVRIWRKCVDDIDTLVDAFFINDPYYPRPGMAVYDPFCEGYRSVFLKDRAGMDVGEAFLRAVELRHAARSQT